MKVIINEVKLNGLSLINDREQVYFRRMLYFNSKGLLIPEGNILSSLRELESQFVHTFPTSKTRKNNYEKYLKYINDLKMLLGEKELKQWINGSFVTQVVNPNDIDLVTFIEFEERDLYAKDLKKFEASGANEIYGVDAYLLTVFPQDHPKHFLFQSDKTYWMNQFGRTRRDKYGKKNAKGFLEIIY